MITQDLLNHAKTIEKTINLSSITGTSLNEWLAELLACVSDDGAIPYLISKKERYRASPLASFIKYLDMANLLTESTLKLMQKELLYLRDNAYKDDPRKGRNIKYKYDKDGWSFSEGVSVWSTSLAIDALINKNFIDKDLIPEIKKSVLWLAKQQNIETNGWAYQNTPNCKANSVMTGLALRALAKAYKQKFDFNYSSEETQNILKALYSGYKYLKETVSKGTNKIYWDFMGIPSCAATTWALTAIKEISEIDGSDEILKEIKEFPEENMKLGLNFILSKMPSKIECWKDEEIVKESGAKYNAQKNYHSFSATLLPELFDLGLSPFHPKVCKQIVWLKNNPESWKLPYDNTTVCSFTYAMLISTIVIWCSYVGGKFAKRYLLNSECGKIGFFAEKVLAYKMIKDEPVIFIRKRNIVFILMFLISLPLMYIFRNYIQISIVSLFKFLTAEVTNIKNELIVSLIGMALIALTTMIIRYFKKYSNRKLHK